MKLVDILARDLKEWPAYTTFGCDGIVQDSDGTLATIDEDEFFEIDLPDTNSWDRCYCTGMMDEGLEVAEDWRTAKVTKEQWEAAKATNSFSGGYVKEPILIENPLFDGAPEGTTHVSTYDGHMNKWHKLEDGEWSFWNGEWTVYYMQQEKTKDLAEQYFIARYSTVDVNQVLSGATEKVVGFTRSIAAERSPVALRERVLEIRSTQVALAKEEAQIIQQLKEMGFVLIDSVDTATEELEADMIDPVNWRVGDMLVCVDGGVYIKTGKEYKVLNTVVVDGDLYIVVLDEDGDEAEFFPRRFKWVRR